MFTRRLVAIYLISLDLGTKSKPSHRNNAKYGCYQGFGNVDHGDCNWIIKNVGVKFNELF